MTRHRTLTLLLLSLPSGPVANTVGNTVAIATSVHVPGRNL